MRTDPRLITPEEALNGIRCLRRLEQDCRQHAVTLRSIKPSATAAEQLADLRASAEDFSESMCAAVDFCTVVLARCNVSVAPFDPALIEPEVLQPLLPRMQRDAARLNREILRALLMTFIAGVSIGILIARYF